MTFLIIFFLWILMAAVIVLDCFDRLPLAGVVGKLLGMTILPHAVVLVWLLSAAEDLNAGNNGGTVFAFIMGTAPVGILVLYWLVRLAVKPYTVRFDKSTVKLRVRAMYGGKILLKWTAISLVFQTFFTYGR